MRLILFLTFVLLSQSALAQSASVLNPTGLPLPRFASLKSDEINMRVGPGSRYPIAYTYTRKSLPVEIFEEFAHWRRIRDHAGSTGWVHKNLLSGNRTALVTEKFAEIRSAPKSSARVTIKAGKGRIGHLSACAPDWCHITIEGYEGWINKADFFGTTREEVFEEE